MLIQDISLVLHWIKNSSFKIYELRSRPYPSDWFLTTLEMDTTIHFSRGVGPHRMLKCYISVLQPKISFIMIPKVMFIIISYLIIPNQKLCQLRAHVILKMSLHPLRVSVTSATNLCQRNSIKLVHITATTGRLIAEL